MSPLSPSLTSLSPAPAGVKARRAGCHVLWDDPPADPRTALDFAPAAVLDPDESARRSAAGVVVAGLRYAVDLLDHTPSGHGPAANGGDAYRWDQRVPVAFDWVRLHLADDDPVYFCAALDPVVRAVMRQPWGGAASGGEYGGVGYSCCVLPWLAGRDDFAANGGADWWAASPVPVRQGRGDTYYYQYPNWEDDEGWDGYPFFGRGNYLPTRLYAAVRRTNLPPEVRRWLREGPFTLSLPSTAPKAFGFLTAPGVPGAVVPRRRPKGSPKEPAPWRAC